MADHEKLQQDFASLTAASRRLFNDNQKLTDLLARFTEVPAPTVVTGQSTAHVPDPLAPAGGLTAIFGAVPSTSTSGALAPAPVRTVPGFKAYSSIREYLLSFSFLGYPRFWFSGGARGDSALRPSW
jgi:hypothetical protein